MPAILLALAISGAVIVAAELLRALDLTAGVRFVIEGLNVAAIAFALAACAATIATFEGIDRALATASDWIKNRRAPQPDEAQLLLATLCEQLHERLQQDGTPPRTVINLTAGQWHEVTKQ